MAIKKEIPHWTYLGKPITDITQTPENSIAFIYKITNLTNGMSYFGRKTMLSMTKKKLTVKEKALPENSRKTFKREIKEYPWQKYTGSSTALNADIKKGDLYYKEILQFTFSKAETSYLESQTILCSGALMDKLSYNFWVSCRIYKKHLMVVKDVD